MIYTINDYLAELHTGQWFGFEGEHTYANLVIHSDDIKPTEQECIDGVAVMQAEWDSQAYVRNRAYEYPSIGELTVALYDTDDKAALETKRAAVKTKWPKDNSGPV